MVKKKINIIDSKEQLVTATTSVKELRANLKASKPAATASDDSRTITSSDGSGLEGTNIPTLSVPHLRVAHAYLIIIPRSAHVPQRTSFRNADNTSSLLHPAALRPLPAREFPLLPA